MLDSVIRRAKDCASLFIPNLSAPNIIHSENRKSYYRFNWHARIIDVARILCFR